MNIRKGFLLVVFIFGFTIVYAQNTRQVEAPAPPSPAYRGEKDAKSTLIKKNKKKDDDEVAEFRERMKKVAKKRRKEERLSQKPQYSDPLYFGHKKPPMKRRNGKKKFCKECGLTH